MIERYGPGGFRIRGAVFTGPVLVLPMLTLAWDVAGWDSITPEGLAPAAQHGVIELLLLGTGGAMLVPPKKLRDALRAAGFNLDAMDTAAACRTYNVLLAEGRRVAAALLPMRA
jgi:uncharacterized protein